MQRINMSVLLASTLVISMARTGISQIPRTRSPDSDGSSAQTGVPRDPRFPYAGVWTGTRTMELGADEIGFRFTVSDGKYSGVTLHPGGGTSPQHSLTLTRAGLTWEQPNSGGGTWVFTVRLAATDSMVGRLVLRDPPANLTPAPTGTMVLTRRPPPAARSSEPQAGSKRAA
jgi:hypothetical protein